LSVTAARKGPPQRALGRRWQLDRLADACATSGGSARGQAVELIEFCACARDPFADGAQSREYSVTMFGSQRFARTAAAPSYSRSTTSRKAG